MIHIRSRRRRGRKEKKERKRKGKEKKRTRTRKRKEKKKQEGKGISKFSIHLPKKHPPLPTKIDVPPKKDKKNNMNILMTILVVITSPHLTLP